MAGRKNIVLLGKHGHKLGRHYNYKKLKSAIRRAMDIAQEKQQTVQIWHEDAGQEVALVITTRGSIRVDTHSPRLFNRLWSES